MVGILDELQLYILDVGKVRGKNESVLKLLEEVGELSEAVLKKRTMKKVGELKGSIEEELADVIYHTVLVAIAHGIDINKCFIMKEKYKLKEKAK